MMTYFFRLLLAAALATSTMVACRSTSALQPTASLLPIASELPPVAASISPTANDTPTPVPQEIIETLFQMHGTIVLMQFNAETLAQFAEHAQSGVMPATDIPSSLDALDGLVSSADFIAPFISPPDELAGLWETALSVHNNTRDLLHSWMDGSTDPSRVLEGLRYDLPSLQETVTGLEAAMTSTYGVDMRDLVAAREEALAGIRSVFGATPTPP